MGGVSVYGDEKFWKYIVVMVAQRCNVLNAAELTVHLNVTEMANFIIYFLS